MADISFERALEHGACLKRPTAAHDQKWSARRTLVFVVGSSLLLWALILAPFFLLG